MAALLPTVKLLTIILSMNVSLPVMMLAAFAALPFMLLSLRTYSRKI